MKAVTGLAAKVAMTEWFEVTFCSVRVTVNTPSDHDTKWNPAFGVAVTEVPLAPEATD